VGEVHLPVFPRMVTSSLHWFHQGRQCRSQVVVGTQGASPADLFGNGS
jgi:hypothetical protein